MAATGYNLHPDSRDSRADFSLHQDGPQIGRALASNPIFFYRNGLF
jgi:hypothetical protein